MSEWGKEGKPKKVSRRDFLVGAGAGATGLVVGAVAGREAFPKEAAPAPAPATPAPTPAAPAAPIDLPTSGKIVWNADKCGACSRCLMACAAYHQKAVAPQLSSIKWEENDYLYGFRFRKPLFCHQCNHPECYYACPLKDKGAITIDPKTGARYIDPKVCTGCGECVDACPFDPPRISVDGASDVAIKCDLCKDREGGPVCVAVCNREALTFVPREEA